MSAGESCSCGSSGRIFLDNMGYSDPLYLTAVGPIVPLSDFVGAGSFWIGQTTLQFYWLCCAVILAVLAHLLWPRGTDLGLGVRLEAHAAACERGAARDRRRRRGGDGRDRGLRLSQHQAAQPLPNLRRGREIQRGL